MNIQNISLANFTSAKRRRQQQNSQADKLAYYNPRANYATVKQQKTNPIDTLRQTKVALVNSADRTFDFCEEKIDSLRARSYMRAYNKVMPSYKTIQTFRDKIQKVAHIRQISLEDFNYFYKKFYSNLNSGTVVDMIQDWQKVRDVYDYKNHIMLGEFSPGENGGFEATQINIFNPEVVRAPFAKFSKLMNLPITLNNAKILPNKNVKADSMVVYKYDEDGNFEGYKTYIKPEIFYNEANGEKLGKNEFLIKAKYIHEVTLDDENNEIRFYNQTREYFYNDESSMMANDLLVNKKNGYFIHHKDYLDYYGKISSDVKTVLNLSDIE